MCSAEAGPRSETGMRSKRLKEKTGAVHERLDAAIMACDPFASRQRYGLFVTVQHGFHRDIDALYADPALAGLLPGLDSGRRLALIEQDLCDLQIERPVYDRAPVFEHGAPADLPSALGALYVAEGSNLGAAFLLKHAEANLDLSTEFGARHLAGAPDGRGLRWRAFTAALDAVPLSDADEDCVTAGARRMFDRVSDLVVRVMVSSQGVN